MVSTTNSARGSGAQETVEDRSPAWRSGTLERSLDRHFHRDAGPEELACRHASLVVELARVVRDGLVRIGPHGDPEYVRRRAEHARHVEQQAADLARQFREVFPGEALSAAVTAAGVAVDALDEGLLPMALLPEEAAEAPAFADLRRLAVTVLQNARNYARTVDLVRQVRYGVRVSPTPSVVPGEGRQRPPTSEASGAGAKLIAEIARQLTEAAEALRSATLKLEDMVEKNDPQGW